MGSCKSLMIISLLMLPLAATSVAAAIDCATALSLISDCSTFVLNGSPNPIPGSPCCDAVASLNGIATSTIEDRRSICRCFMGVLANNPSSTAIATLPGFCGVFFGFTVSPTTNCNYIL